jgi:hypothetical protein
MKELSTEAGSSTRPTNECNEAILCQLPASSRVIRMSRCGGEIFNQQGPNKASVTRISSQCHSAPGITLKVARGPLVVLTVPNSPTSS